MNRNNTLRLLLSLLLITSFAINAYSQKDKGKRPSPPAQVTETVNGKTITIDYSQPAVKGRLVLDGLIPYGKVWRTGANEATWIELSDDVMIGNQTLPKGKYSIFTIAGESEWTIAFNKVWDQWGHYNYDEAEDQLRITVKPQKSDSFAERFTINISKEGVVSFAWENVEATFTIK
ncbi:MAG: hypothetical protein ACI83W_002411 [Marinoscillum sp.]|jgi:hypothetical protein